MGAGQAEAGAGGRQHQGLGSELAGQSRRRSAQSGAYRDLAPAPLGAQQQQTGDVDGGDHEQQSGPAEQHQQDRANIADDNFGQGKQRRAL